MENIKVFVRVRPNFKEEESFNPCWTIESNNVINNKTKDIFTYDKIFDPCSANDNVFESIKENVKLLLSGINVTVFVYGQTSTGKTFTMRGNDSSPGLIPCSVRELFNHIKELPDIKVETKVSYMELYNETINDLLDPKKKNLDLRESAQKGIFVENLTEVCTESVEKVNQLIKQGDGVRVIAETKLNDHSSRSHTIFRLNLQVSKKVEGRNKILTSQFNLVDLAGSENVSKAKTEGIRIKEGSNINKSLLALSMVIFKLSCNQRTFINYRDSKLTRLLQSALSGNSKTTIICTISQNLNSYQETLNTLNFGSKAKTIKTTIKINECIDDKAKILQENTELKSKIKKLEMEKRDINKAVDKSVYQDDLQIENNGDEPKNDLLNNLEKEVLNLKKMMTGSTIQVDADTNNYPPNSNFGYSASKYMSNKKRQNPDDSFISRCFTESKYNQPSNFDPNVSAIKMAYQAYENESIRGYRNQNEMNMLLCENEELKRSLYELQNSYLEQENVISNLNVSYNTMVQKCEQILNENEENFLNLKLQFDRCREELIEKEEETKILLDKISKAENLNINLREQINCLQKEIIRFNEESAKFENLRPSEELTRKNVELQEVVEKLSHELQLFKELAQDLNVKLEQLQEEKRTASIINENTKAEIFGHKYRVEILEKNNEVLNSEITKLRAEINHHKNEIANQKERNKQIKSESNQLNLANTKLQNDYNKLKTDYEKVHKQLPIFQTKPTSKIDKPNQWELKINENEKKIEELKSTLIQKDKMIEELKQKIGIMHEAELTFKQNIDENSTRIHELQLSLTLEKEKNRYLETLMKVSDQMHTPKSRKAKSRKTNSSSGKPIESLLSKCKSSRKIKENDDDSDFMGKKRKKLPKIYQSILEKTLLKGTVKSKY